MAKNKNKSIPKKPFRFTVDDINGYLFIAVAIIVFAFFTIYPVVSAVTTSFENYKPFGSEWVGFKNYMDTFKKDLF